MVEKVEPRFKKRRLGYIVRDPVAQSPPWGRERRFSELDVSVDPAILLPIQRD
jgi:hypothetical protein